MLAEYVLHYKILCSQVYITVHVCFFSALHFIYLIIWDQITECVYIFFVTVFQEKFTYFACDLKIMEKKILMWKWE
jgi:hypothetical protein